MLIWHLNAFGEMSIKLFCLVLKLGDCQKINYLLCKDIEGYHMYKCISEVEEIMDFPTYLSESIEGT